MKVSIIVTCYNYAQYLTECIESILDQTYTDFELILVDDCSTDSTQQVVGELQIKHPSKIKYFRHEKNRGLAATWNTGIKNAKGKYILTVDCDNFLDPQFLEMTVDVLDEDKADIVGTYANEFGERKGIVAFNQNPTFEDFKDHNQITSTSLYRRVMWEQLGGYDELMLGYQDYDYFLRATKAGFRVKVVQLALFWYRIHKDSMNFKAIERHEELKKYMFAKLNN